MIVTFFLGEVRYTLSYYQSRCQYRLEDIAFVIAEN